MVNEHGLDVVVVAMAPQQRVCDRPLRAQVGKKVVFTFPPYTSAWEIPATWEGFINVRSDKT